MTKIIQTPKKKNYTNADEKSEAIPDDQPATAKLPEDKLELEVNDETQIFRNAVHVMEDGVIDDQTSENEDLETNDDIDGQTLEFDPDSLSPKKSVMVFEAWKQHRQQSSCTLL